MVSTSQIIYSTNLFLMGKMAKCINDSVVAFAIREYIDYWNQLKETIPIFHKRTYLKFYYR